MFSRLTNFFWSSRQVERTSLESSFFTRIDDSGQLSYVRNEILGRGSYGFVFHGHYKDKQVAVKRIQLCQLENNNIHEMERYLQLEHQNVNKILTWKEDEIFRYIILELCWGSLSDIIDKAEGKRMSLPPDVKVLYEITDGLDYLHSQQIIHHDIKPDKILISMEGRIKISGFFQSKHMGSRKTYSVSGLNGTVLWMAPELLSTTENYRGTTKSDIFSAGCVFFFFLTRGVHPFGENAKIITNILNNQPVNINELYKLDFITGSVAVIRQMIMHESQYRPTLLKVKEFLQMLPENVDLSGGSFKRIQLPNDVLSGIACVRFHPTESLLSYVSSENGAIIFLDEHKDFSKSNSFCCQIGGVNIPTKALEWNVDGTQRADFVENSPTMWKDDLLIWKYTYPNEVGIIYQGIPLAADGLDKSVVVWNPFHRDVLATYKKESNKELRIWKSFNYNRFLKHNIETAWSISVVKWISKNQLACCYYQDTAIASELLLGSVIKIHQFDDQDLTSSQVIKEFKHSDKEVKDIAWNKENQLLASCSVDGWIKVWSIDKEDSVKELKVEARCLSLVWCPNRKIIEKEIDTSTNKPLIVCGLSDGSILIWSPFESDSICQKLTEHTNSDVNQLLLSPNKRFLASCSFGNELIIWSTVTWENIHIEKGGFSEMSWNATSCKLAALNQQSQLLVLEYVMAESRSE